MRLAKVGPPRSLHRSACLVRQVAPPAGEPASPFDSRLTRRPVIRANQLLTKQRQWTSVISMPATLC